MDFFENLEIHSGSFTKNEKIIYQNIIKKPHIIEKYTITGLESFLNVSKSSIMRFCKKLGYSGYSEFRFDYIKYAKNISKDDEDNTISDRVLSKSIDILDKMKDIDERIYIDLAEKIHDSNDIYIVGMGKSSISPIILQYSFARYSKYIAKIDDPIMLSDLEKYITKNSLIIIFSTDFHYEDIKKIIKNISLITKNVYIITNNEKIKFDTEKIITLPKIVTNEISASENQITMMMFVEILSSYYVKNHL